MKYNRQERQKHICWTKKEKKDVIYYGNTATERGVGWRNYASVLFKGHSSHSNSLWNIYMVECLQILLNRISGKQHI